MLRLVDNGFQPPKPAPAYIVQQCKVLKLWNVINSRTGLSHSSWCDKMLAETMCRDLNYQARRGIA